MVFDEKQLRPRPGNDNEEAVSGHSPAAAVKRPRLDRATLLGSGAYGGVLPRLLQPNELLEVTGDDIPSTDIVGPQVLGDVMWRNRRNNISALVNKTLGHLGPVEREGHVKARCFNVLRNAALSLRDGVAGPATRLPPGNQVLLLAWAIEFDQYSLVA